MKWQQAIKRLKERIGSYDPLYDSILSLEKSIKLMEKELVKYKSEYDDIIEHINDEPEHPENTECNICKIMDVCANYRPDGKCV